MTVMQILDRFHLHKLQLEIKGQKLHFVTNYFFQRSLPLFWQEMECLCILPFLHHQLKQRQHLALTAIADVLDNKNHISFGSAWLQDCLLYTSDAADERSSVDLG